MYRDQLQRSIAFVLLCSTVFATIPVSATELASPNSSLGYVTGVGPVSLRGIPMMQEGTVFGGDDLQVGAKGYAKVTLVGGYKLELDESTNVNIRQNRNNIVVQIRSGNVGFTAAKSSELTLLAGPYEVSVDNASSGNLSVIGTGEMGVRTMKGKVTVRQTTTKSSYVVAQGQERVLTFDGESREPLTQVASNVPTPIPAVPPPIPQRSPGSSGLSAVTWTAIAAGIGGAAATLAFLASSSTTSSSSPNKNSVAQQNLDSVVSAAKSATSADSQLSTAAVQTVNAIGTSPTRATLRNRGLAIQAAATNIATQLASITTQLNSLQVALNGGTDISAALETVRLALNVQINSLNTQITALKTLITDAGVAGVKGLPNFKISLVASAPALVSCSVPGC